jgi:hypothetical protein
LVAIELEACDVPDSVLNFLSPPLIRLNNRFFFGMSGRVNEFAKCGHMLISSSPAEFFGDAIYLLGKGVGIATLCSPSGQAI